MKFFNLTNSDNISETVKEIDIYYRINMGLSYVAIVWYILNAIPDVAKHFPMWAVIFGYAFLAALDILHIGIMFLVLHKTKHNANFIEAEKKMLDSNNIKNQQRIVNFAYVSFILYSIALLLLALMLGNNISHGKWEFLNHITITILPSVSTAITIARIIFNRRGSKHIRRLLIYINQRPVDPVVQL